MPQLRVVADDLTAADTSACFASAGPGTAIRLSSPTTPNNVCKSSVPGPLTRQTDIKTRDKSVMRQDATAPPPRHLRHRETRRVEGIGLQVDFVAVVVAITVTIRAIRIGAHGRLIRIREAVSIAIDTRGPGGRLVRDDGSRLVRTDCLAVGGRRDAP